MLNQIDEEAEKKKAEELEKEGNNFLKFFDNLLNSTKRKEITIRRTHVECVFNYFGHLKIIRLLNSEIEIENLAGEILEIVREYHKGFRNFGMKFMSGIGQKLGFLADWAKKTKEQDALKKKAFEGLVDKVKIEATDTKKALRIQTNIALSDFKLEVVNKDLTPMNLVECFAEAYYDFSKQMYALSKKIFFIFGDNHSTEEAINHLAYK